MVAPGPLREVGRDGQDLRAGQRQCAVELGEAQVIADAEPQGGPVDVGADQARMSSENRTTVIA